MGEGVKLHLKERAPPRVLVALRRRALAPSPKRSGSLSASSFRAIPSGILTGRLPAPVVAPPRSEGLGEPMARARRETLGCPRE
jgi:hypothetical protein